MSSSGILGGGDVGPALLLPLVVLLLSSVPPTASTAAAARCPLAVFAAAAAATASASSLGGGGGGGGGGRHLRYGTSSGYDSSGGADAACWRTDDFPPSAGDDEGARSEPQAQAQPQPVLLPSCYPGASLSVTLSSVSSSNPNVVMEGDKKIGGFGAFGDGDGGGGGFGGGKSGTRYAGREYGLTVRLTIDEGGLPSPGSDTEGEGESAAAVPASAQDAESAKAEEEEEQEEEWAEFRLVLCRRGTVGFCHPFLPPPAAASSTTTTTSYSSSIRASGNGGGGSGGGRSVSAQSGDTTAGGGGGSTGTSSSFSSSTLPALPADAAAAAASSSSSSSSTTAAAASVPPAGGAPTDEEGRDRHHKGGQKRQRRRHRRRLRRPHAAGGTDGGASSSSAAAARRLPEGKDVVAVEPYPVDGGGDDGGGGGGKEGDGWDGGYLVSPPSLLSLSRVDYHGDDGGGTDTSSSILTAQSNMDVILPSGAGGDYFVIGHVVFLVASSNGDDINSTAPYRMDVANAIPEHTITLKDEPVLLEMSEAFVIAMSVIIALCFLWQCYLLLAMYRNRTETAMQIAQVPFLALLVACAGVAIVSSVFWIPLNDVFCNMKLPLTALPCTIIGSILVGRVWRAHCILSTVLAFAADGKLEKQRRVKVMTFLSRLADWRRVRDVARDVAYRFRSCRGDDPSDAASLSSGGGSGRMRRRSTLREKVTNHDLARLVAVLTFPQVVLQIVRLTVYPEQVVIELNESGTEGVKTCTIDGVWVSVGSILLVVAVFLLAIVVSWVASDLPSVFNEKNTIFTVSWVTVVILMIMACILIFTHQIFLPPNVQVGLHMIPNILVPMIISWMLVMPKLFSVWSGEKLILSDLIRSGVQNELAWSADSSTVSGTGYPSTRHDSHHHNSRHSQTRCSQAVRAARSEGRGCSNHDSSNNSSNGAGKDNKPDGDEDGDEENVVQEEEVEGGWIGWIDEDDTETKDDDDDDDGVPDRRKKHQRSVKWLSAQHVEDGLIGDSRYDDDDDDNDNEEGGEGEDGDTNTTHQTSSTSSSLVSHHPQHSHGKPQQQQQQLKKCHSTPGGSRASILRNPQQQQRPSHTAGHLGVVANEADEEEDEEGGCRTTKATELRRSKTTAGRSGWDVVRKFVLQKDSAPPRFLELGMLRTKEAITIVSSHTLRGKQPPLEAWRALKFDAVSFGDQMQRIEFGWKEDGGKKKSDNSGNSPHGGRKSSSLHLEGGLRTSFFSATKSAMRKRHGRRNEGSGSGSGGNLPTVALDQAVVANI